MNSVSGAEVRDLEFPTYLMFLPKYCALSCEASAAVILEAALRRQSFGVTALAVHGLIESITVEDLGNKINKIDMILPDGQAVVWALNSFYKLGLGLKFSGPTLVEELFRQGEGKDLQVYLYGSTADTLSKYEAYIERTYPWVTVCGTHEDRFRDATAEEDQADIEKIRASGANVVLVGRGCPRQEHWVADHVGKIDASMLAVGAAFDYHAGKLKRAPVFLQRAGLEWLFRLVQEPRRLWRRYAKTNTMFIYFFLKQKLTGRNPVDNIRLSRK